MLKKILCVALSITIAFTAFAITKVSAQDYIEIYTFEDLENIADNPDGSYKLMADIDMGQSDWYPMKFSGVLDGNNYTLYNLSLDNLSAQSYITVDWHHNEYETYFASLFSKCENATIMNLNLVNVEANIETDKNCFVAGIAGIAINTQIINCHVTARFSLTSTSQMVGIGGLVGFGEGYVADSTADLTAVIVDSNEDNDTEEFIGGIWATGYPTVENCSVVLDSYTTTFSYAHDGGIIGMHRVYEQGLAADRYIANCSVDVTLNYFDHNIHGHRHFGAIAGERINPYLAIYDNTITSFTENKYVDYTLTLEPCMCKPKIYDTQIVEPTCDEWGHTTYTCLGCDYSYIDDYTQPAHIEGQWETAIDATYDEPGLMVRICTVCGEVLEEKELAQSVYSQELTLTPTSLEMYYLSAEILVYEIAPLVASDHGVVWSSSDEDVVVVDEVGTVYTTGRGTATITCAAADGNTSAQCQIEVKYTFKQWLIVILLFGWIWY